MFILSKNACIGIESREKAKGIKFSYKKKKISPEKGLKIIVLQKD